MRAELAGASFDMQMGMGSRGGKRTLAELQALFGRGGLALEEVVGPQSIGSIRVARPPSRRSRV